MTLRCNILLVLAALALASCKDSTLDPDSPNILLVMTDDQSWLHTSWLGTAGVATPNFDRIAREGVYFRHAYASAPSCTASRSAVLAGQQFWQLDSAAVLWGEFSDITLSYQNQLAEAGYHTGYTGKGWGPGETHGSAPAGPEYNQQTLENVATNLSQLDYAANFRQFLETRPDGAPFSFWFTPFEPHRPLSLNPADAATLAQIDVPPFLPDNNVVRQDIWNYYQEIAWQDQALGEMLAELEFRGLLENTLVIVTSDNGMPFPRSKATNYQTGVRVPLAMRWAAELQAQVIDNAIANLSDLAPTILDAVGLPIPMRMSGRSLLPLMNPDVDQQTLEAFGYTVTGFERHILNARESNASYPSRAVQTENFTLIRNYASERWPVGDPPLYRDIDTTSPSREVTLNNPETARLATAKRPALELFDLRTDPFQLRNRADDPELMGVRIFLDAVLSQHLQSTSDPLLTQGPDSFQGLPYYGPVNGDARQP